MELSDKVYCKTIKIPEIFLHTIKLYLIWLIIHYSMIQEIIEKIIMVLESKWIKDSMDTGRLIRTEVLKVFWNYVNFSFFVCNHES